jgi:hypothetical protein
MIELDKFGVLSCVGVVARTRGGKSGGFPSVKTYNDYVTLEDRNSDQASVKSED